MSNVTTRQVVGVGASVRQIDAMRRSVEVVASTEALDSHGTVIDQGSWNLTRFMANPVVFFGHQQRDLPIGYADAIRVENGALRMSLNIAPAEANPDAERVWQLIQHGSLRAVSVGMFVGRAEKAKLDGRDVVRLMDNELIEVSVVGIGSNPETVAKMRAYALGAEEPMTDPTPADAPLATRDTLPEITAAAEADVPVVVDEAAARAVIEASLAEERTLRANAEKALVDAKAERDGLAARVLSLTEDLKRANEDRDARVRAALYDRHAAKLTPALRVALDKHDLADARALLEAMPSTALREDAAPPAPLASRPERRWEEMKPSDRASVYTENRALYEALKADWAARGKPTGK
jgi:HK97 family phage prohead protease